MLVNLEDLWLDPLPQKVPGTRDERPNWRRKACYTLETFSRLREVVYALQTLARSRRQAGVKGCRGLRRRCDSGHQNPKGVSMRYDVTPLTDYDLHLFNEGTHSHLYKKLGAHPLALDGEPGTCFGVWAPNAEQVFVMGDFNGWRKNTHRLRSRD